MALKRIRLELARTPEFPEGSTEHGYVFKAPLDTDGHLDRSAFRKLADACTVHRFWAGEDDETGVLIHKRGGWAFSYEPGEEDDEPIHRLDSHVFKPGEYVTVTEHDGVARPFRVVSVDDLVI